MTETTPALFPSLFTATAVLTALVLSITTIIAHLSRSITAYLTSQSEITPFINACTFSISENESYDLDITKIPRLEDKVRLHALYREIQRNGDELREELNRLLVSPDGTRLRTSARLMWREKRKVLEERMRRGDMLRMRFLVVYLGLIASTSHAATNISTLQKDPSKWSLPRASAVPAPPALPLSPLSPLGRTRPKLPHAVTEGLGSARAGRGVALGHNGVVKPSWGNVIEELQRSPLLHRRRESIEVAELMRRAQGSPT